MGALITRLSAAICLVSGILTAPAIAREEPLTSVADLRYGVALYHYHLNEYMPALTELLVAEKKRVITGHGDNPKIMEAGLAMGYNMERYASDIFDRLLEKNRSVEVRDAAWFYLAKLRYAHGEWTRSEQALNKLSEKPVARLRANANALRFNLLIKQGQNQEAVRVLEEGKFDKHWLPYFYFNIGSAFARAKDYRQAVGYFDYLGREEYSGEEYRALFDKAMTASGFSYLFLKDYQKAKEQFTRVRLTSALSNRALLGYGWAAAELGDYQEALKPWQHLASNALVDENNQEAMIAVPYAYEKLGSEGLALESYQRAEQSFGDEITKIDEVLATLDQEDLLSALQVQARGEIDWMHFAEESQLSPRLSYLVTLFSQDAFQSTLHELQDLLAIRDDLHEWNDKLVFYSEMLTEREVNRGAKTEYLQVASLTGRIEDMRAKRETMAAEIARIKKGNEFFSLATGDEADLINRALRSEENVEMLRQSDPFIDEYEESVRRYKGLLFWQASEQFSERLWQATKVLNQLDSQLNSVSEVNTRVDKIMSVAPDLSPYRVQMAEAHTALDNLLVRVEEAILRNESDLKDQVLAILQGQRARLSNYLAQSRLAVARLYDKAIQTQEQDEYNRLKAEADAKKAEAEKAKAEQAKQSLPTEFNAPSLTLPESEAAGLEKQTEEQNKSQSEQKTQPEQQAQPQAQTEAGVENQPEQESAQQQGGLEQ